MPKASQPRTMTLEATEFIRRFLLHVLPSGFVKIRHFGFLANRCRQENILLSRQLLAPGTRNGAASFLHLLRIPHPWNRKQGPPIVVRLVKQDAWYGSRAFRLKQP